MINADKLKEVTILLMIADELEKAKKKFPEWPKDIIHQAAIVGEESGELIQACLQNQYEKGPKTNCIGEAIQVAAMAIRFLENNLED